MATNGKRNGNGSSVRFRQARRARRRNGGSRGSRGLPRWMLALLALGAIGFLGLLVSAAAAMMVYNSYADDLVAPDELAINKPSYGAKIYDRNGLLLYEYVDDQAGLRRPIKLENVADSFLAATIATEDDSFFTNPGVNVRGLARAAWENFSPLSDSPGFLSGSGGSSITQQLVKNVYIDEEERQKRSISRKIKETVFAIELTQRYSKEKILEWYVNQISYGGVYNGVEAAAQGYFGKSAAELTLAEAALLAGIPQSPAEYDPINNLEGALARRDEILDILLRKGRVQIGEDRYFEVDPAAVEAARQEPIQIVSRRFPIEAPHFVLQYVQPQLEALFGRDALYRDGLVVRTSLDLNLQNRAADIMEGWIREFEAISNSRDGSLMVMDPKTGEILVMIGSRDYFNDAIEGKNNNATACNSPGSAFKPFVYLSSFINRKWGPGTLVLDTPVSYGEFTPVNPARNFAGPVTIRYALGNSLNVPPVKVAAATGPDQIVIDARKLGFMNSFRPTRLDGCTDGYGVAIATGGIHVTLEEMMFGYATLANGGVMIGQAPILQQQRSPGERKIDPVAILEIKDSQGAILYTSERARREERVVPEAYTYLIYDILSDPQAQCATFQCGGITVPGYRVAVKTGTSEPYDPKGPRAGKIGETWAFGYTRDYVVGIWAGNASNEPVDNIYSTSISFRTMRDVMRATYNGRPQTPTPRPADVVEATVCMPSGLKPTPLCGRTTTDIFAKDTVPEQEDNWWQRVRIDTRNGKLAAPNTPPQYVEEKTMLVPPPEAVRNEEDRRILSEWANVLGVELAPSEVSDLPPNVSGPISPDFQGGPVNNRGNNNGNRGNDNNRNANGSASVMLTSPNPGANVSGTVSIQGRARSDDFVSYKLEFGAGEVPVNWITITQDTDPVDGGTIALWNTANLPPGTYSIRLSVIDGRRGVISSNVTVNVGPRSPNN